MKQDRLTQIKHLLMQNQYINNNELAETFGVSIATIRRDLDRLESEGVIRRIYGGAELIDGTNQKRTTETIPLWTSRADSSQREKQAIAKKVAEKIPEACTVFIDNGTTVHEVAKLLTNRKDLTILTNSLRTALLLGSYPDLQIYCIGGIVKYDLLGTAGIIASEALAFFPSIDVCVLSSDGFIPSWGLRECSMETAMLKKTIVDRSKIVIAALDHTKFYANASAPICQTKQLTTVVTDPAAPPEDVKYLRDNGVEVIIAPLE
ncbi:MAG: DeoR/GlpR transcriptional regulator [Oscillospiraceae bacterium]|nr:DeoR/GlpR transcriptional regulator [Oscillospiraceae bacterium]